MSKKIFFCAWVYVSFLFFSSWTLADEVRLRLLLSEEEGRKTGFEIEATRPVAYQRFNVENPRGLVVDFLENGIYSSFDKEIIFEDGPVEEIRTFFLDEGGSVDSLFFKFRDKFAMSAKEDKVGLILSLDEVIKQGIAAERLHKAAEVESALNFSRQKARVHKTEKDFILVPQENREIIIPDTFVPGKETALLGKAELSAGEPDSHPGGGSLPLAEKPLSAQTVRKFCSLLEFTPVFAYLLGSLSLIGAMSFWYAVRNNGRGSKLLVPPKKNNWQKTAGAEEEIKIKPKAVRQRRKFHRLEMEDIAISQKPKIKIETSDEIKANYNCRLKNLGLGGLCFELRPHINVPLIMQLELELPKRQLIEICARVAWQKSVASNRRLYGANFLAIGYEARENLRSYLEMNFKNNGI